MSDPAVTPAAEIPAPAAPDFAAFEAAENKAALSGDWPAPAATTSTATETADAPAVTDTAAAVEAKAAPITDTGKDYTPPNGRSKRTVKDQEFINEQIRTRVQEAIESTERRLRAEFQATKPAAEPAKPEPVAEVADPKDPEPVATDFDDYDQFTRAAARWAVRQERREADAESTRVANEKRQADDARDFDTKFGAWTARRDAFVAKHPDRASAVLGFVDAVQTGTPIGDTLMESEVGAELADYFAANISEAERIARLSPVSALRELGKLEARFTPTTSASASAGPAAKTVTTAPAPPTTLAARSADPADPVAAAVARGDYSAFELEENRRAIASR
jgi:hypothetical protein